MTRSGSLSDWLAASRPDRDLARQAALERIRSMDASIQAWVQIAPQPPTGDGPLDGIPFGAKDIIETRGLATEYGSAVYEGRIGTEDAAIVRDLRQRGAILLGKTRTTAFAYRTPGPTRNPRNLAHTPGGSSSGSAAAVAAGMVPLALGTQTQGSVLRPASYCGITGFKPTYGLVPMDGVLPLAKSLDTLGFFTETPGDMLALWESLGFAPGTAEDLVVGVPDPLPDVEPEMRTAFQRALARLAGPRTRPTAPGDAGISIRSIDLAPMLATLCDASSTVMFYEGARLHQARYREHGDRLADIAVLVRQGLDISEGRYDEARRHIDQCRARVRALYEETPIIVVPAATGPAPPGLASTGDPRMNAPWTALGTPAISIPMPVAGLPLGLQLTANRGDDARVIRAAVRVHAVLSG